MTQLSVNILVAFLLLGQSAIVNAFLQDEGSSCLKGKWHAQTPNMLSNVTGQCVQYANYSCCTPDFMAMLDIKGFRGAYNFSLDHCPDNRNMSDTCKMHFMDDLCAYECNPYWHPWIAKADKSWREERFLNVPLCHSSCQEWYEDCKDDFTCSDNWFTGFNWTIDEDGDMINTCPNASMCAPISQIFDNDAVKFCESIWNRTYRVIRDADNETMDCFSIRIDRTNNPFPDRSFATYLKNWKFSQSSFPSALIVAIVAGLIISPAFLILK